MRRNYRKAEINMTDIQAEVNIKKKRGISLISLLIDVFLIVTACIFICAFVNRKTIKADIVFLGDSIFGNVRDETSIPGMTADALGMSFYNGGLGGTMCSPYQSGLNNDRKSSAFSLFYLSEAIRNNEFSFPLSAAPSVSDGDLEYFDGVVKELSKLDYANSKMIIIEHGLNDFMSGVSADVYYESMLCSVENLLKIKSADSIYILSPVYGKGDPGEYVKAGKKVADITGVHFIDMYNKGIVTKDNLDSSTIDGIHLSKSAREEYAYILSEEIKKCSEENEN